MKQILWTCLLASFYASAQSYSLDTLPNAAAYITSFSLLSFNGTTKSGGVYIAGFNEHWDENGKSTELELVRFDLTNKKVQYKRLNGFTGGSGYSWNYTFDKSGNIYISMLYPDKKVLKLNLKDSIWYENVGNPFVNSNALIYSLSLGRDGNIYFGSSSGRTYWSEYNATTKVIAKHPLVDAENDYVLSILGDSDYVYLQTGQRNAINLWSVNKHNDEKHLLFSIPNTTRFNLGTFTDGIYASVGTDTLKGLFRLINGKAIKTDAYPEGRQPISGATEQGNKPARAVIYYYDQATSQVYFSFNKKNYDSIPMQNGSSRTDIRRAFSFPNDRDNIYYVGDYYGNYYRYSLKESKAYLLGSTGYNIYSFLALNDSMIYLSGYPSGFIMLWNKNQPWATQKIINGKRVDARDANANPKILHYWKGEGTPAAGFHHTFQMLKDNKGNLIGAGDVIRIGNAASIGVYNAATNKIYGINYTSFTGLQFAGIALWNDLVVYSMRTKGKKKPKLYFYDPSANHMVDSIDLGFDNYGKIFIKRDMLTGVADNRIYTVSLKEKKLRDNYILNSPVFGSYLLHDGRFVIKTSAKLPAELKQFIALPVANYHEANNILYAVDEKYIVRVIVK